MLASNPEISRSRSKISFLEKFFEGEKFYLSSLPADASFRTYDRVLAGDKNFILMDSPPTYYSLVPFIKIAEFLSNNNFSAPKIYSVDYENGFLLLEDFGNKNIGSFLSEQSEIESRERIYKLIVNLLLKLQAITPPNDLQVYNTRLLLNELELYTDWYIPSKTGKQLASNLKEDFLKLWENILEKLPNIKPCLVLRDYHVENMMLLKRNDINSIGLLDFQDAIIGHPIYDLVSVLEDARIEVNPEFAYKFLDYYLSQNTDLSKEEGYLSYHILAAQRNSRILGVFARKAVRDGQSNYLNYIPRVLTYLENDLSHEALEPIRSWIKSNL